MSSATAVGLLPWLPFEPLLPCCGCGSCGCDCSDWDCNGGFFDDDDFGDFDDGCFSRECFWLLLLSPLPPPLLLLDLDFFKLRGGPAASPSMGSPTTSLSLFLPPHRAPRRPFASALRASSSEWELPRTVSAVWLRVGRREQTTRTPSSTLMDSTPLAMAVTMVPSFLRICTRCCVHRSTTIGWMKE